MVMVAGAPASPPPKSDPVDATVASPVAPMHASPAPAWRFEPSQSAIRFELTAVRVVRVRGGFQRFEGEVAALADGDYRVTVRIDAASLAMDSPRYDNWARSDEFFDAGRHPQILFRSDAVPKQLLRRGGKLDGMLTLRGITRAASFDIAPVDCPEGALSCELAVTGEINRGQFGMRSRRMTLSERVRLDMRFLAMAPPFATETDTVDQAEAAVDAARE